jgi:hypothetical protein
MFLSGNFGTVTVGAIEAGNGILGLVTAGGPTFIGLDNGTQLAGASNVDILKYTSPSMNGFSFAVATLDAVGANGAENGGANTLYAATYANGPVSVDVDYTDYGSAAAASADKRTRVSANYDLGMAKVGVGLQKAGNGTAGNNTGYDLAAQYNLSKRTYVALQAQSTKAAGATASATTTRVQLAHSF